MALMTKTRPTNKLESSTTTGRSRGSEVLLDTAQTLLYSDDPLIGLSGVRLSFEYRCRGLANVDALTDALLAGYVHSVLRSRTYLPPELDEDDTAADTFWWYRTPDGENIRQTGPEGFANAWRGNTRSSNIHQASSAFTQMVDRRYNGDGFSLGAQLATLLPEDRTNTKVTGLHREISILLAAGEEATTRLSGDNFGLPGRKSRQRTNQLASTLHSL